MNQEEFLREHLRHQRMLFAFVMSIVRRRDLADDIVQDTALIAFKKLDTFEPGTNFGAWIREIARRRIRKALEEQGQRRALVVVLEPDTIEAVAAVYSATDDEPDYWERRETALARCLQKLKEKPRKLMAMRYGEGLGFDVLARKWATSANSIQVMLAKIRHTVRLCAQRELLEGDLS